MSIQIDSTMHLKSRRETGGSHHFFDISFDSVPACNGCHSPLSILNAWLNQFELTFFFSFIQPGNGIDASIKTRSIFGLPTQSKVSNKQVSSSSKGTSAKDQSTFLNLPPKHGLFCISL